MSEQFGPCDIKIARKNKVLFAAQSFRWGDLKQTVLGSPATSNFGHGVGYV